MGEVIQIRDIQAARERAHRRAHDHQNIELALALMRQSLVAAADQLRITPVDAHAELLERIEKLAAAIRYGVLMLGELAADDSNPRS
jgi:hypothetical protein